MARLLHLSSSPRGDHSHTRKVATAFLDAHRNTHPSDEVREIDLWTLSVPRYSLFRLGCQLDYRLWDVIHRFIRSYTEPLHAIAD
jgi:hypothetical protein